MNFAPLRPCRGSHCDGTALVEPDRACRFYARVNRNTNTNSVPRYEPSRPLPTDNRNTNERTNHHGR